jgi:L-2-hydroxyglutarate oxidase
VETADFLVIGGGIVGLAVALEARQRQPKSRVVLLEKEASLGRHASGRNSGVLHAGIYYPPGSLKARFSRMGNQRLVEYCADRGLPINRCGKVIVARDERERRGLDELLRRGRAAGVPLEELDPTSLRALEPSVRFGAGALFSPTTASIDPVALMASLTGDAVREGVEIRAGEAFREVGEGVVRTTRGQWSAGYVVNAAGVHADRVARSFGFAEDHAIVPFKGHYLQAQAPVTRHVYPVPDLRYPFLGVHLTVSTGGRVWLGPTATPVIGREQYGRLPLPDTESIRTARRLVFLLLSRHNSGLRRLARAEVRRWGRRALVREAGALARELPPPRAWKGLRPGIRAQLVSTRRWKLEDDFVYEADGRSCHVLNAVSPGLTCALPLAEHLHDIIEGIREQ